MKKNKKQSDKDENKKKLSYKYFFKIFKHFKLYKRELISYIFIAILFVSLGFFEPIILGNLIARLGELNIEAIYTLLAIYLGLHLGMVVVKLLWTTFGNRLIIKVISNIRNTNLSHMFRIKNKIFDSAKSGKFKERIIDDGNIMIWNFLEVIDASIQIIASLLFVVYVFTLHFYIGALLSLFLICYFLIDNAKNKAFAKNQTEFKNQAENFNSYGMEIMRGVRDIKILHAEPSILKTFSSIQKDFYQSFYVRNQTNIKYYSILTLLNIVFFIAIIVFSIFLITLNQFTVAGMLIVYSSYDKMRSITLLFSQIKEKATIAEISAKRTFELQEENAQFEKEKFGEIGISNCKGKIQFNNVTFAYENKEPILKNFNLKIEEGQMIGIVGESGGGKSTLLSLITRMYDISGGEVLIDDINVNDLTQDSLRNSITYINQNPYLFYDTILNNLRLSYENLTLEDAIEACKLANIHNFIIRLEHGYNTMVGENGVQLSGGQRQRIAIARALIKRNKIILMDEATSSLDNESQKKIKELLSAVARNHTLIIVAHRLSTIIDSDRIIAIKDGEIVADGTHLELLENSPYYMSLYNSEKSNKKNEPSV